MKKKEEKKKNKAIAIMCLAYFRAFIQQTNTHKHKQPRLDYSYMYLFQETTWLLFDLKLGKVCINFTLRIMDANKGHQQTTHLTLDLLVWPVTPEYHGGQFRASTNQVWLQTDAWLESYQP